MKARGYLFIAGLLASTAAIPAAAWAGEEAPATAGKAGAEPAADAIPQVEDVIVTAQRRESRLQETPISVTAISAASLEARGIRNLNSLDTAVPNLQLNNGRPDGGGSAASATIRGVGQNDFQFPNDPGVGIYLDGVYMASAVGGLMSMLDVQRVEVLRGPQGTLFGRNTIGGAINITTQAPTDTFGGDASLTYGSYNRVELKGSLNIPLVPGKLDARLTGGFIRADGLGKQIPTGVELSNENRKVVRLVLRATPSDDLTIDFSADYTHQRQNGAALAMLPNFPSTTGNIEGLFNPVIAPYENAKYNLPPGTVYDSRWASPNRYDNYGTAPQRDWLDAGGAAITTTWKANDSLTIKSITAVRGLVAQLFNDLDLSPYDIINTLDHQHQKQYSQEIQFYGDIWGGRVEYLAGGYLFKEIARDHNTIPIFPDTFQLLNFEISQVAQTKLDDINYAGFGQVSIELIDGLKLTAGMRENYEHKRFAREFTHLMGGDIFIPYEVLEHGWTSFTPKVGLDWKVSSDALLYASYAEGFKGGGWNPRPTSSAAGVAAFDPETIKTYEIGAKTEWFDRRLTFNVAGFHSNYSDIQIQVLKAIPGGGFLTDTQNGGTSSIWGGEAELVARPVAQASIQLSAAYLSNKYTELTPGSDISLSNKLPDAPKWTFSGGADYRFSLADLGDITPRVDVIYRSKTYKDAINSQLLTQPGYWLVNGRISFRPASRDQLEIQAFVTNLFDQKYLAYGQDVSVNGATIAGYGRPREFGVTARCSF